MVCLGIVYPIFIIIQFRSIKKSLVNRFLNTDLPKTVEFPVRVEYYMDVFSVWHSFDSRYGESGGTVPKLSV